MAGREMTAWVAGLAFLSANLGSLELMGWAGNSYKYGILAAHWYWIGAIPAMLFLALVMMPFYHICKTHSVPGYLKLRFGHGCPGAIFDFVRLHDRADERHQHVRHGRRDARRPGLGHSPSASWCHRSRSMIYVALGGLRSAIFNEVLQFFLIWAGALLIPILGLVEAGGWSGLKAKILQNLTEQHVANPGAYTHAWSTLGDFRRQSHGDQLGRHRLRTRRGHLDGLLDHRLSSRAARTRRRKICARPNSLPSSAQLLR